MNSFEFYLKQKEGAELLVKQFSEQLRKFPKLPNGLVPDDIKKSPSYREVKAAYNLAFKRLQEINYYGMKHFNKEIREHLKNKRKC